MSGLKESVFRFIYIDARTDTILSVRAAVHWQGFVFVVGSFEQVSHKL